jgi:hypothetical protein
VPQPVVQRRVLPVLQHADCPFPPTNKEGLTIWPHDETLEFPLYRPNTDVGGSLIKKGHHFVTLFFFFTEILPTYTVPPYVNFLLMPFHVNSSNRILLASAYLSKRKENRLGFLNDRPE